MIASDARVQTFMVQAVLAVAVLLAIVSIAPVATTPARAQGADAFPGLETGRRVYDDAGTSLTPEQVADLERQLSGLEAVGADAIVYVRALDATPDETLAQVEALQQAWVATTGADQDNAVAILINRNPDDPNDARAGIHVGSTFDDGNVPRDEQEAIVDEALIPPLREGDMYGSVAAGLDRLERSIVNGPPRSAFEKWAADTGGSWFPWAGVGAALAGLAGAVALFRNRQTTPVPDQAPTTTRPGEPRPRTGRSTRDRRPAGIRRPGHPAGSRRPRRGGHRTRERGWEVQQANDPGPSP